jgi:APA family basic amino acid/polyamine antiporter
VAFYAYIGFDMVSASSQEARNPTRDIPLALILTLGICTALFVGMSLVMTGLAPYRELNVPHPVYVAIEHAGPQLAWLGPVVGIGVVLGLASAMLVCIYGQSRIFYRMSLDGLIPPAFGRISRQSQVPVFGTCFVGAASAVVAGLLPIGLLGELVSIGTLLAFAIVCAGVVVLRKAEPHWPRGFRAPALWPVALLGIGSCLYMMISLPIGTWVRLIVWLSIGGAIYFGYGRKRSMLAGAEPAPRPAE